MKHRAASIIILTTLLIIGTVSAGVFNINDAKATIGIKPISSDGQTSKDAVLEKDLKTDTLQAVKLELSKDATVESKTIQMYPGSSFLISDDFSGSADIMQTSTKEGYPLMEVYYRYQKSDTEPWQYYFRIEKIDKDNAYVIYSEFSTKSVWLGKIPRSNYDMILSSGKIPDWGTV